MSGIEQQPCCCEKKLHPCCASWQEPRSCTTGQEPTCEGGLEDPEITTLFLNKAASGCYATEEDCREAYEQYDAEIVFYADIDCEGETIPENVCPEQPCENLCLQYSCAQCGVYLSGCSILPCDEECDSPPPCPDPAECCNPPPGGTNCCRIVTDGFGCPVAASCEPCPGCGGGGGGWGAGLCFEVSNCASCVGNGGSCIPCISGECQELDICTCTCCNNPQCSNPDPPGCCAVPQCIGPGFSRCPGECGSLPPLPPLEDIEGACGGPCCEFVMRFSGCDADPCLPGDWCCVNGVLDPLCLQTSNLTELDAYAKNSKYGSVFLFGYGEEFL
jgi:hypothetical protein